MCLRTSNSGYNTPADSVEVTYEIKKSRFIARAGFASSREQAIELLNTAKADYPDARHHCWAYQLGNPVSAVSAAISDDGEPSGTAGKPILNVLQHKGVGDVMLVVVRYFGGIKLGAGGLVRAYSAAAQQAMDALPVITARPMAFCQVTIDFAGEQVIRHWLAQNDGEVVEINYTQRVTLQAQIPEEELDDFRQFVGANRGSFSVDESD